MEKYTNSFLGFTQVSKNNSFMIHSVRDSLNHDAEVITKEVNLSRFESLLFIPKNIQAEESF